MPGGTSEARPAGGEDVVETLLTHACHTDGCEHQGTSTSEHWCPTCALPNDPIPGAAPPPGQGPAKTTRSKGWASQLGGQETAVMAVAVVVVLAVVVLFATRGVLGIGSGPAASEGYSATYGGDDGLAAPVTEPPVTESIPPVTETTTPETTTSDTSDTGPPVELAGDAQASASATASDNVDGAGDQTTYDAANVLDDDPSTAWRVEGNGRGVTLTLTLPGPAHLTEVGLIPGYAKVDPVSGDDRFTQERRITEVRWRFDDQTSVTQDLVDEPEMQRTTVDVDTATVVIEIAAAGPPGDPDFDYTAISDVSLLGVS
jgi:hypothetical protein